MVTFMLILVLSVVCFVCGYTAGYANGWWKSYEDFAPSMQSKKAEKP